MSTFKVRAVVIKETSVGEADKILTLFCKDKGKITVSARGAKKPKSKFLAGAQLFTWSDFVVFQGNNFYSAAQIDVIESFYGIRQDFDRLRYGSYCLELMDRTILPEENCNEVLKLLLKTLQVLGRGLVQPELAARIFELKFLEYEGYRPQTDTCIGCGEEVKAPSFFFGMEGLLCPSCKTKAAFVSLRISEAALYTISYILSSELEDLFRFKVSEAVLAEMRKIAQIYMRSNYDTVFKSLNY